MKSIMVVGLLAASLAASPAQSTTHCQGINSSDQVANSDLIAKRLNKLIKQKGGKYKFSPNEIVRGVKSYCASKPYASADEVTTYLINSAEVIAASEKM
jgi:hypothetical protein